jgi:uncharacterized protein YeaO (DUF488 family)
MSQVNLKDVLWFGLVAVFVFSTWFYKNRSEELETKLVVCNAKQMQLLEHNRQESEKFKKYIEHYNAEIDQANRKLAEMEERAKQANRRLAIVLAEKEKKIQELQNMIKTISVKDCNEAYNKLFDLALGYKWSKHDE